MIRIVDWNQLDSGERSELVARPTLATAKYDEAGLESEDALCDQVQRLIHAVRDEGDVALRRLTRRFDGVDLEDPWVPVSEIAQAEERLPAEVRAALDTAIATVTRFHQGAVSENRRVETAPGVVCESRWIPLNPVGLYVPAGTAPLPSTAVMLAVPARLAGCGDIVMATPPNKEGEADPAVLAVAARMGIERVLLAGGAQAVAALAYGTESVPAVAKIFGPGNRFVAEAKRQVAQDPRGAALDLPAGPSEVMIVADGDAPPEWVAIDLLSQAEHGPDSQVFLVTDDAALPERVAAELARLLEQPHAPGSRPEPKVCVAEQAFAGAGFPRAEVARKALEAGAVIRVSDLEQAIAVANAYAPEHLILATDRARALVERVTSAGSVFLGYHTPEALGDYISGTNHVLPTGGWARVASGLSVTDFMRRMTVQESTPEGLRALGPDGARLAAYEGLDAHRLAITMRLDDFTAERHIAPQHGKREAH